MIDRYLRRLGLDDEPPSVEGLFRLQRAHVERVAYENLEIWLDRPTTVDPAESARRIVSGRGGYCFHLNGALSLLLEELGYQVTRHYGGVQNSPDVPPGANGNHLALMVAGLPTADNPGGQWLVDAGLGDAIHEPLPLVEGTYEQGPFRYVLRRSETEPGGWRFDHDPRGSFTGVDFRPEPTGMDAFAEKHRHLSTSPESVFVKVAALQRRDATGLDKLTGLVLKRIGAGPESSTTLDRPEDYFAALTDVFGLTLDDVTAPERDKLWQRLYSAHERWLGRNDLS
ncbi:arylamine N-acetyltransferase [Microtetraspora sp. NBRC 16547]|uniref:arylamine N-acetyltransferase family protein n=1 Tax=Microtetraspora sp. NBRC 16547 TaxID=3030993 RepID=UPI0024A59692|nr:arylamine N-acetyltransferase [Microtetraspora sp. NBRC 16547]GLX03018.1 arylamine N-acetyltransferase [Microtetraspora sp. NBRC 16547]